MEQPGAHEQTPAQTGAQAWRFVVAQATGVLMSRFSVGPDAAIERLATMAAENNRPLLDVAREIVDEVNRSASDEGTPPGAHGTIDEA